MKTVRFQLLPLACLGCVEEYGEQGKRKKRETGVCFSLENLHTWLLTRAGKKKKEKKKKREKKKKETEKRKEKN